MLKHHSKYCFVFDLKFIVVLILLSRYIDSIIVGPNICQVSVARNIIISIFLILKVKKCNGILYAFAVCDVCVTCCKSHEVNTTIYQR